jgi:hypothetical protein
MNGRGWAYAAVVLGGGMSIAANVAHTYVVNPHPSALAVGFSVFWPVALFVAIEIMARTAWPRGWGWRVLRFGGLTPVAAVAAVVSYRHLSGLLAVYGEHVVTIHFGPLAVDGLMAVAATALFVPGRRQPVEAPAFAPAPARVELPAEARPAPSARPRRRKPVRRPAALTRQMPTELEADGATRAQVTQRLGISERGYGRYCRARSRRPARTERLPGSTGRALCLSAPPELARPARRSWSQFRNRPPVLNALNTLALPQG